MTKLIMADGTIKKVSYNQAAEILQMLNGVKKPKDKMQAKFLLEVKEVSFDDGLKVVKGKNKPKHIIEHDPWVDEIMADSKLNGRAKARAIAKRIKERRVA